MSSDSWEAIKVSDDDDNNDDIDCNDVGDMGGVVYSWAELNESGEDGTSGECSPTLSNDIEMSSIDKASDGRLDNDDPNEPREPLNPEEKDWGGVMGRFSA